MLVQLGDYDIEVLIEKKNNKNVYFVGMTNVGKSTIVNKIIKILS